MFNSKCRNMKFCSTYFITSLLVLGASSAELPDNIKRCSISSPELKGCLSQAISGAIQAFKGGYSPLGLPSLEPLHIPNMVIGEGSGPVNVVQNFTNVDIHGLTVATMTVTEADINKNLIVAQTVTDRIELLADYTVDGQILVLPVKGNGRCNITIIRSKSEHRLIGERHEKKGKTYFRLKEYRLTMDPEMMYYNFANLFNGDERLGAEINKVMNENWKEVFADVKAGYEKTYSMIFLELANNLFGRVPFDGIFLP